MKKVYSTDHNFDADLHTNEELPKIIRGINIDTAIFVAEKEDREDDQEQKCNNVFSAKTFA